MDNNEEYINHRIELNIDTFKSYFSEIDTKFLLEKKYKIIAHGTSNLKINCVDANVKAAPYEINMFDTLFLIVNNIIELPDSNCLNLLLDAIKDIHFVSYIYLKTKGYFLLSGIKYGCDFMVYKGK